MGRTILVAGKDMPASSKLVDVLSESGRFVVATEPCESTGTEDEESLKKKMVAERQQRLLGRASGVLNVEWNKGSPISCRTLILNAESTFKRIDEAVLFFDESDFSSRGNQLGIEECSLGADEMILSYQFLTLEILARFKSRYQEGNPSTLIFLLKEGPSASDAVIMPALHNGAYAIASPVVAAAAAAFASFAENIVALYGDQPFVNIVLVRGDHTMESATNDTVLGKWLCSYIDVLPSLKTKLTAKKSLQWIKPGAKIQGSSSRFGKK